MRLVGALLRHPLSAAGSVLATLSATLFLVLAAIRSENPYVGIITYLIVPAIFVLGLILIPLGILLDRRGGRERRLPLFDLNDAGTRWRLIALASFTLINAGILTVATTKGVETVGTNAFCSDACHTIMEPQATAFVRSPHASIDCVACHVAPGADGFIESKLNGASQAIAAVTGSYDRPVSAPGHGLPSSDGTCLHCHSAERAIGDRLVVRHSYDDDRDNTALTTAYLLHVGSGGAGPGAHGIHVHADPRMRIRYRADATRERVYEVEVEAPDDRRLTYRVEGETPADARWFEMGCNDCHNRIGHPFRSPEYEVDRALLEGRIAADLPFVRREGVRLLREGGELARYYEFHEPELAVTHADAIAAAESALAAAREANVFPAMQVDWGTYPDHIGHEPFPGCFRCHDDAHTADDGSVLSSDCSRCHTLLAVAEPEPEILETLSGW